MTQIYPELIKIELECRENVRLYYAPELKDVLTEYAIQTKSSDIWRVGIIGLELCIGKKIFERTDEILEKGKEILDEIFKDTPYNRKTVDVLKRCLSVNPGERFTVNQLLRMPAFN